MCTIELKASHVVAVDLFPLRVVNVCMWLCLLRDDKGEFDIPTSCTSDCTALFSISLFRFWVGVVGVEGLWYSDGFCKWVISMIHKQFLPIKSVWQVDRNLIDCEAQISTIFLENPFPVSGIY